MKIHLSFFVILMFSDIEPIPGVRIAYHVAALRDEPFHQVGCIKGLMPRDKFNNRALHQIHPGIAVMCVGRFLLKTQNLMTS